MRNSSTAQEDGPVVYAPTMAAALSGATIDQLRHWRSDKTGPLLAPEITQSRRFFYSFRDVLALRTCVKLRQTASLQKVRRAIGSLRALGEIEHLASYSLVSDRVGNIQLVGERDAVDLAHGGQRQLFAVLGDVIEAFPIRAGVVIPNLLRPRDFLSVDPQVQGGFPVIKGTRVPYDAVANLIREAVPASEISNFYPSVSGRAANDALDFARYVDNYDRSTRAA
jgi:uncharacterized protein (DUF433 family)/DNA-binding transcriptional MerR regulator